MLLELMLIVSFFMSGTLATEICKSDSGRMTISEETNILAIFKGMAIWVVKFPRPGIFAKYFLSFSHKNRSPEKTECPLKGTFFVFKSFL